MWEMNGTQVLTGAFLPSLTSSWQVAGIGDFNGDGKSDILLLNTNGTFAMWEMNGTQVQSGSLLPSLGNSWHVAGVGDFNGDHVSDILLQNANGSVAIWEMNGTSIQAGAVEPVFRNSGIHRPPDACDHFEFFPVRYLFSEIGVANLRVARDDVVETP